MASQGPLYPSSASDLADETAPWSSPGNVSADDGTQASASLGATQVSNTLRATGFGFSVSGTVDGFELEVKRVQAGTDVRDERVELRKGDGTASADKAGGSPWSFMGFEVESYGGAADLWGLTVSDAEVNDAGFGVEVQAANDAISGATASIEYVRLTVHYSPGGGGYTDDMLPQAVAPARLSQSRVARMVPY
jgi:hypothetical protein